MRTPPAEDSGVTCRLKLGFLIDARQERVECAAPGWGDS